MARTSYPKKPVFVPVDYGKLAFEDISLDEAIKGLKKLGLKNVKLKKLKIKGLEKINIAESLMEDFSKTDLKKEKIDLSNIIPKKRTNRSTRHKIEAGKSNVAVTEIIDTDVVELLSLDVTVPFQEALDNIISMISINQG